NGPFPGEAHGQEKAKIFPQGGQRRRERDAPLQARHRPKRQGRQRRQGQEPRASHRDRPVQGAQEGQESPQETVVTETVVSETAVSCSAGSAPTASVKFRI